MTGHFMMFNEMIQTVYQPLTEDLIKKYHYRLKSGVYEELLNGYNIGEYKNRENKVSDVIVSKPKDVENEIKELLAYYNSLEKISLLDICEFHSRYEAIHPFQDGTGRTGRINMFKE